MKIIHKNFSLFCAIVDFGKGSKVLKKSKELGASGGTFILGKGTVRSSLLKILGLDEVRKELLLMVIEEDLEEIFHEELTREFSLDKPNHGIAFSTPVNRVLGLKGCTYISNQERRGGDEMKYEGIVTIVDRGLADDVVEAARAAGATGGTVMHGRGSGIHEKAKLFNIEIEPEKDIVLILSESQYTDSIIKAINEKLNIEKPGAGIIFVFHVNKTSGIMKNIE
ncbi:MAG: P-II family nitrogen regulator [Tissierellia bacterium]|nr:P-II family nitrogen regulator [Tissierellia bacterium]